MSNEVYIGSTPITDLYISGTIVQEMWEGSTQVYGRTIVNTADPMVYNTDCTLLLSNKYLRQRDDGVPGITSDSGGVKFEITDGGGTYGFDYGGFGCQLTMANDTSEGLSRLSGNTFTAIIETGPFVNMSYVRIYAMNESTYPSTAVGTDLVQNTVNTVTLTSDPGTGAATGIFFISGERATDATWSFKIKNASIVSGDWT